MIIGLGHYLVVAAILFTLGIFGIFLNRKNVIVIMMSIELILLAVNINLVAFSYHLGDLVGQAMTSEALVRLLMKLVEPSSWNTAGGPGTIAYDPRVNGLLVSQTPELQKTVGDILQVLREAAAAQKKQQHNSRPMG